MPKPTKKVVEESSSEEEEIVTTKKVQKTNTGAAKPAVTKKAAKVESDSSDEEEIIQPAKGKTAQKAAAKKAVKNDTSDTSSEDEAPKKAAAKPAAKVQPKKKVEESSSEEDEPVAPPKKTAPVKAAAKKVVESDDESSEEEAPKKAAAKPAAKVTPKVTPKVDDSVSESSEEEVKPVKKAAPVKAAAKKVEESDDESSEEEVKPVKKAAPAKKVVEESEEEEEEEEVAPVKTAQKPIVQAAPAVQGEGKGLNHPNEVIVKGLPFAASEHDLTEYFKECGALDGVNLLKGPDGRSKGIAFVRFTEEAGLQSAVGFSGSDFGGRSITIEKTVPRDQRAPAAGGAPREFPKTERDPTSASIFVGNLSYQTTEDSLWGFFETCGQVASVRVAKDPEGNPRGFAHVDFASPDSVEAAVQKAGSKLDGRPIRVDYSTPKKNDGQRGGFGGGNRFGGDRQGGFGGGRGFGGGNRGPPGGNRMNLGEEDNNRKKGSISSFQGSKQRL